MGNFMSGFMHRESGEVRKPDFTNLLKVLNREKPDRPTLFEFFLNERLYDFLTAGSDGQDVSPFSKVIRAFSKAGYDYVTVIGSDFNFPLKQQQTTRTISLNSGAVIIDRESFESYPWPDPDKSDYSRLETLKTELPDGMKLIVFSPDGVLENVIRLAGFENLCYMLADDPELANDLFNAVGSRLLRYYELCAPYDSVGALISNDDWGFRSQTMLSVDDMRRYVFPWHRKITETIHKAGKPAILHSCGQLEKIMDDIIDDMKYDAKHSFEDTILPVEEAFERWGGRIAILGGIDVDFLCRSKPEDIYSRSLAMLERSKAQGGYALGSGNSIPDYVPDEAYFSMISAAH